MFDSLWWLLAVPVASLTGFGIGAWIVTRRRPRRCANGPLVHDFKGGTTCPACGYAPVLIDGVVDGE